VIEAEPMMKKEQAKATMKQQFPGKRSVGRNGFCMLESASGCLIRSSVRSMLPEKNGVDASLFTYVFFGRRLLLRIPNHSNVTIS
jgi:hypothetical protein